MTSRKDKFGDGRSREARPPRGEKPAHNAKSPRDDKAGRADGKVPRGFVHPDQILPDPWRVPVAVEQIPDTGVERSITADAGQLTAIAQVGGLRSMRSARATLTLQPGRGSHIHVTGRVTAVIGQTCVVSLEDMETEIDEAIDISFAPPSKIPTLASTIDDSADDDTQIPDPPEPIVDGVIDIGRVATDALFLAVDPYPRKPDAVFEAPVEDVDPDEHPFAALKALKDNGKSD